MERLQAYWSEAGIDKLVESAPIQQEKQSQLYTSSDIVIPPDAVDLARLHWLVMQRKVTTVLEIGVGFSTTVLADAISRNKEQHHEFVSQHLRRGNAFEIHSVDAHSNFIDMTRDRMAEHLKPYVSFCQSNVKMSEFEGRICTYFDRLPNICPDLIYLDGPDQFAVKNDVRGISTAADDRLPMSADLLSIEHFLLPGTLIVVDGRAANARFLNRNFQRDWHYVHDKEGDVHLFELRETPLGRVNAKQIEFCLGPEWIAKVTSVD